jgi:succinyl-CoA synthetase beta subunit
VNVHEYQAKQLLARYEVPVPKGKVVTTPEEAEAAAREIGGAAFAVKAQIHAGGRGKAGGIKLAKSPAEVKQAAASILGKVLVTPQTGPAGKKVHQVWVEQATEISRELYLGLLVDRATAQVAVMASAAGGMEIEAVAKQSPEKILTERIDPAAGLMPFQARKLAFALELSGEQGKELGALVRGLYRAFLELDCSLIEINPLVVTKPGKLLALDAKVNFDDSALFRHPELEAWRDEAEEDPIEAQARKLGVSYVHLDGSIGCLVNGAGLAMTTMDVIKARGGAPANFLDIGGRADTEAVAQALSLIMADPKVKVILINIFAGIIRCDMIAEGIIAAVKQMSLKAPMVIRLSGTNYEKGRQMLRDSGLAFTTAETLNEAAEKAVALLKSQIPGA